MIKEGTICIWQNCVGVRAVLNDTECTALSGLVYIQTYVGGTDRELGRQLVYKTDSKRPGVGRARLAAKPHELREKYPPQDETNLIEEKEMENG